MGGSWTDVDLTDPEVLAAAFEAFPTAAARVSARLSGATTGAGRFVPFLATKVCGLEHLYAELSLTGLRLLQLAKIRSGLDREVAVDLVGPGGAAEIDRVAATLAVAGLASMQQGRLTVNPDVAPDIPVPLPMLADQLAGITSDRLALACRLLGVNGGTRKDTRAAAVLSVLTDPVACRAAVDAAGPAAREMFFRLLKAALDPRNPTFGSMSVFDLLEPQERVAQVTYRRSGTRTPLAELADRMLIGDEPYSGYEVWIWLETAISMGLDFLDHVPLEPPADLVDVDDPTSAPARVVAALHSLLHYAAAHPVEGKKSGDRRPPVRHWRSAAKACGVPQPLGELLREVAADLGLVYAATKPTRGRGRNAEHPVEWRVHAARVAELEQWSPARTWLAVVSAWLSGAGSSSDDSATQRWLVWTLLASMPAGQGTSRSTLAALCSHRHLMLGAATELAELVDTMCLLGITSTTPGVGLSRAARAASAGLEGVEAVLDGGSTAFVVQPDHTIVAPPDLSPGLTATLARYADLVSEGGATVWRLSAVRLARLAATTGADEVLEVLRTHASSPVPDGVARFVADAMTTSAPVAVIDAACVIVSTDVVAVADAARHKSAKLTVVAPGVAVSPLPRQKVAAVLAEKGVLLAGSPADRTSAGGGPGGTGGGGSGVPIDAASSWFVRQRDPQATLPTVGPVPVRTESARALASRVTGESGGRAR